MRSIRFTRDFNFDHRYAIIRVEKKEKEERKEEIRTFTNFEFNIPKILIVPFLTFFPVRVQIGDF